MKIAFAIILVVFIGLTILGCGEEEEEGLNVRPYGTEIGNGEGYLAVRTFKCLTIGLHVYVDGKYIGEISSDEPAMLHISPGTHDIYIRSNGGIKDSIQYFYWNVQATAAADHVPELFLNCLSAEIE